MRRLSRSFLLCSLLAGLAATSVCVSTRAVAQTASEIAAAKQWFQEGMKLEEEGKWAEALEKFRRAAAVKSTAQILFHQGLCEKNTGALVEAILSFSRSASAAREAGIEHVETSAQSELAEVRARVPKLNIVTPSEKPKSVTLDGQELSDVSLNTAIPVNPGRHEVVAVFGGGTFKQMVDLAERQTERLVLEAPEGTAVAPPPAAPAPPSSASPAPTSSPEPTAGSGPGVLPWVLIGGGAAVAIGGGLFWMKRGDEISKLDDLCPQRDACPANREDEIESAKSDGKLYSVLGLGMLGIGVAGVATGGVLLFGGDREVDTQARIVPGVGPNGAGATLTGRF